MLETLSNGMGGQSMLLLWMAVEKMIPASCSITADTGSEEDRVLSDGSRISATDFFHRHIKPLSKRGGLEAFFVRATYRDGTPMPPLHEHMRNPKQQNVPLFGSEGGRLRQTCTDKWKMRAIRQQMRRMGAKKARSAIGLHHGEALRRMSGIRIGKLECGQQVYNWYQTVNGKKNPRVIQWMTHYYPLIDLKLDRDAVRDKLNQLGIPYLVSSECDHCPHKDDSRWLMTSPEKLEEIARLEEIFQGEFFFTDRRIPLRQAIEEMKKNPKNSDPVFGCKNGLCGI